jgi:ABC-type nitrate/sulfonate/bicarbonate transport system substrate-binding protein
MTRNWVTGLLAGICALAFAVAPGAAGAADKVKPGTVLEVPFIFWGGDVATFHANGGLETTPDSLFGKQGLKLKLVPGDDFGGQVKNYLDNKTPFLRGTMSMLGQASEDLTKKTDTTPVVFLQLTWSAGDHLVGRAAFKDLNDLKGKKIALQEGGPHVGMLNDILNTVKLTWKDITVVWTKDVSGDKGPAELFRKDQSVDACFAISPEMFELTSAPETGGVTSIGDGTKKSIKGAHVVVSTQHMARSIADVYAVRKDFYDANKDYCEKFAAAYIKACEELIEVKKKSPDAAKADPAYKKIVKLAQDIWGRDAALKDSVARYDDVDGLISDANFVGLPGNEAFFTQKGNLSGFEFKMKQAISLPNDPSKEPLRAGTQPLKAADFSYAAIRKLGDLHGKAPTQPRISAEVKLEAEQKIFEFVINFEPNSTEFSEVKYGADFQRALEQASLFGNAVVAIRGHADPRRLVDRFINAATTKGILKNGKLYGKDFDPKDTKTIFETIKNNPDLKFSLNEDGRFNSGTMTEAVDGLQKLSDGRADNVRRAIQKYADSRGLVLEKSQLRHVGVGGSDPVEGYPQTDEGFARNRRVQFVIIKVPAEKVAADEFDL